MIMRRVMMKYSTSQFQQQLQLICYFSAGYEANVTCICCLFYYWRATTTKIIIISIIGMDGILVEFFINLKWAFA